MLKNPNLLNTDIKSLALTGTSLDYMYQKFMDVRNDIAENDVIGGAVFRVAIVNCSNTIGASLVGWWLEAPL